jgi:molecular chaperone DnaK (HSP70)
MGQVVGIDLGTTNSAVARIDEHGFPVVVPNALGDPITPSVICFRGQEIIIGAEAKELQAAGEPRIAAFFKRRMGDESFLFHAAGNDYTATDLSALLLQKLKSDAEQALGEKITDAVITVPAYFRNPEREATRAAGQRTGFNVLQLVNEPTAAAIAFGIKRIGKSGHILVYDLGGGTFDVTLCNLEANTIKILTSSGDHELGGKDWDDRIVRFSAIQFERQFGIDPHSDSASIADLLARSEEVKKRLSAAQSARISLVHEGHRGTYEITREHFQELTQDLMQRTVDLTSQVFRELNFDPNALDQILLVGGSTRMPMVHDFIRETFGKGPLQGVNVDEAVALGAAIVAMDSRTSSARHGLRGKVQTVDVTNHSLGMIAINNANTAYVNSVILQKNQPIPCAQTRPYKFRTRKNGENRLEIFMTQGEVESPADVTYINKYIVTDIPHRKGGDIVLDIEYAYDESGTVRVSGYDRNSKKPLTVSTEPLPSDLPDRFLGPPEVEYGSDPVTLYIAIDLSGSMSGVPLQSAKAAAETFVAKLDLAHCAIGVIAVADFTAVKLKANQNARQISEALSSLSIGEVGCGNDADPFDQAHDLLAKATGQRFLIVLADGVWSDQRCAIERAKRCHKAGIEVIAIGFGGADEAFLRAIASSNEGSFFTSMEGLQETFGSIAQVITESADKLETRTMLGRLRGR